VNNPPVFRPVVDREFCEERLKLIFPPNAFDAVLSNRLAASSVAAMIYVGAVVNDEGALTSDINWVRPQTVLSMSDEALARAADDDRAAWASAAEKTVRAIVELLGQWDLPHNRWYAPDSRETIRDETWPKWLTYGVVRRREGIPKTSSLPRWALTVSFADLFLPNLEGQDLADVIEQWRSTHMTPGDRLKIQYANDLEKSEHQVPVNIPGYGVRYLEPGVASAIIKGVIEAWAPLRLNTPIVVAISEPGTKVWVIDAARMAAAGISINVSSVLPDAIILDAGTSPPTFWIIEAVASDGEINEGRKQDLLSWAQDQYIDPVHCEFLSAFPSRNSNPARKRFKDIAVGTYCWFLDEPERELSWRELPELP
jgi:hypothetical protein